MKGKGPGGVEKVERALKDQGFECRIVQLDESTRTASDAAFAVSCDVGQIVKSLIFKGQNSEKPFLVVASGANRVNVKTIEEKVGEPVKMAKPDFVKEKTGFVIGGVPPLGHKEKIVTFIDSDLLGYKAIWAAAGNSNSLFSMTPEDLKKMTGGVVITIR
jgi:prolyl-tRNA editing enzyme YbaK/EbsC (Cys-tRNA(Pro) deacylase)